MAQRRRGEKDLLTRLADAGEEAIQRLGEVPGGKKVLDAVTGVRDRVDELQHRVRDLAGLEKRVQDLEKKVAALSKKPATRRRTATTRRTTTARKVAPKTPRQSK